MRAELGLLVAAFTGCFTDQHAFLLGKLLARVAALDADLAELDAKLAELLGPLAGAVERLDAVPGLGRPPRGCCLPRSGRTRARFPTAGHLGSWARFAPGVKESAGNRKGSGSTGRGNPYLARVLGEAAVAASKTKTFLGARSRRITRRRGKRRAIVAVGRSILVIAWHLLADPEAHLCDLGASLLRHPRHAERATRNPTRQLAALGDTVTLQPAA